MKNILLIAFMFSSCLTAVYGQWIKCETGLSQNVHDFVFPVLNSPVGYAVASGLDRGGIIIKTEDGGVTWKIVHKGFSGDAGQGAEIQFLDENTGFFSVGEGILLRTTDGGTTWQGINIPPNNTPGYYSVETYFLSATTGFYLENGGRSILKTTDGGVTWTEKYKHEEFDFFYISRITFPTPTTGYVYAEGGSILKTTDAGESWSLVYTSPNPGDPIFNGIVTSFHFINSDTGFFSGMQPICLARTTDGGVTWQFANTINKINTDTSQEYRYSTSFFFLNDNLGFATGSLSMLITRDGGDSWKFLKDGSFPEGAYRLNLWAGQAGIILANGTLYRNATFGQIALSVNDATIQKHTLTYPNPFTISTRIELPENLLQPQIRIFTSTGEQCLECFKTEFEGNFVVLRRTDAPAGLYYYKIISDGKSVAEGKVIVE